MHVYKKYWNTIPHKSNTGTVYLLKKIGPWMASNSWKNPSNHLHTFLWRIYSMTCVYFYAYKWQMAINGLKKSINNQRKIKKQLEQFNRHQKKLWPVSFHFSTNLVLPLQIKSFSVYWQHFLNISHCITINFYGMCYFFISTWLLKIVPRFE